MILSKTLSNKSFAVYGLGVTGLSVLNCLKKSKVKNFYLWDDDKTKRNSIKIKLNIKDFLKSLKFAYHLEIHEFEKCISILKKHNISQICFLSLNLLPVYLICSTFLITTKSPWSM